MKRGEWVLIDNDSFKICRKIEKGLYELYQIHLLSPIRDADQETDVYAIAHDLVCVGNIDYKSVCYFYGYDSKEAVKEKFGDDWERVLAEWNFDIDSGSTKNILMITSDPYVTWKKARKLICQMSGYTCDQFMNIMKKKKEYSSGKYRFYYIPKTNSVRIENADKSRIYHVKSSEELENLISKRALPFRICQYCGLPMEAGYTNGDGTLYFCCKEELESDMDDRYGERIWRKEPTGEKNHYFEYYKNEEVPGRKNLPFIRRGNRKNI